MTYGNCNEIRLGQSILKFFDINFLLDDKVEIFSKDYVVIFFSQKVKIFLHLLVIASTNLLFLSIIYIILNKLNFFKRIKNIKDDILRINTIVGISDNNSNDSFIQLVNNNEKKNLNNDNNIKENNINDSIDNNNIGNNSFVINIH